ncbi:YicC/YloC family endoribonuclease [Hymenobacter latericus]|uniref:YicC/YloC family endoribonuclease n=1 Tax=Hymenobacter sp. YIM 151858-1 TaxID=2987688 RepID=UPI0022270075|nr:YicC/YloC family endoribonuclease [Hymenobacter sp. YIM 151858-1]UYZ57813.1 YicC family protein [Hymenobacter sp. YIM 151858-1]
MLLSMTGYGVAHHETEQYTVTIEIKSLNSKGLDLGLRTPRSIAAYELELRNLVSRQLVRGKVNVSIDITRPAAARSRATLNREALMAAYQELQSVAQELGDGSSNLLELALRMPGVVQTPAEAAAPSEEELALSWDDLQPLVQHALDRVLEFRRTEGQALTTEILSYIDRIRILLSDVERHDPTRLENVRRRMHEGLGELMQNDQFNPSRFEQELLYYIEKLDIAEEKVRLISHLHYFTETVHLPEHSGKKLIFISQEIGREINTIGSKANDSTIQHLVVGMKEELEKIKEQLNNIL